MKHLVLLLVCSLYLSACVPAMVTNTPAAFGRVTDAQRQTPLSKASVSVPGRSPTATTNSEGRYKLPYTQKLGLVVLLPFDFLSVPVEVSHPGYRTVTVRVPIGTLPREQNVALEPLQ